MQKAGSSRFIFASPLLVVPLVALALAAASFALSPPEAAGDGASIAPGATLAATDFALVDSRSTGSELNVAVASNGYVFVGGWDGVTRSTDGGFTWEKLEASRTNLGVAGNGARFAADRALIVDKDTDRLFLSDTTLACTILGRSDDYGESWAFSYTACGGGVTDHQKVAVGPRTTLADPTGDLYPNVVYVCANGLSHTNCGVSVDGGATFLPGGVHGTGCAFQGAPVAGPDGTLYEPSQHCNGQVRFTKDNGFTWTERRVKTGAAGINGDTPDLAVTPDGTLYFFFMGKDHKPYLARSVNDGASWDGPFPVMPDASSALFPTIVAGDDGRVALGFYATAGDAADGWAGNPGEAPDHVRWHAYVAVVTDAASDAPTITPVQVTPADDPVQIGCLSKLGGGCLGNIADYMDIDVGPDGSVYYVYTDGCLPGCSTKAQSISQTGMVAVQVGGPRLFAT